jgi:hypothetical protein
LGYLLVMLKTSAGVKLALLRTPHRMAQHNTQIIRPAFTYHMIANPSTCSVSSVSSGAKAEAKDAIGRHPTLRKT